MIRKAILYSDGASRGNPGPAAIGLVLTDIRGKVIKELGETIGRATNNEAEYRALVRGLECASALHVEEIEIRCDSELIVAQIRSDYRIHAPNLKPLHTQAMSALLKFKRRNVRHVPRESNTRADALANRALDRKDNSQNK